MEKINRAERNILKMLKFMLSLTFNSVHKPKKKTTLTRDPHGFKADTKQI